jgi:hypothetical protein
VNGSRTEKGCEIGETRGEEGGRQLTSKQKISTIFKISLDKFCPPPKNILFVDDVDASEQEG